MTQIEKIRQEIEQRIEALKPRGGQGYTLCEGTKAHLRDLLSFLDTLEAEEDFDDVAHYTKVREIKTGKVFWAEYSTESAEWYEAGTGNAYSISDVEIVKEQQEVDLDSEIEEYWIATEWSKVITLGKFKVIARYFYGLGQLNSK